MRERFRPLDKAMQADTELAPPPFEDRPSRHYFYEMPEDLDVAGVIEEWH